MGTKTATHSNNAMRKEKEIKKRALRAMVKFVVSVTWVDGQCRRVVSPDEISLYAMLVFQRRHVSLFFLVNAGRGFSRASSNDTEQFFEE